MSKQSPNTPIVYPYPHPRDCDVIQGKLDACTSHCDKCATGAFNYLQQDEDYDLDMGIAGHPV